MSTPGPLPATWAIASNEAVNTPTLGAELLTNGDFSAWTGDDPDGWTVGGEVGADPEVCEVGVGESHANCGGAGTGYANLYTSATANQPTLTQSVLTVNKWYFGEMVADTIVSGRPQLLVGGVGKDTTIPATVYVSAWAQSTSVVLRTFINTPADATIESVSVKELTLNTLFSSVETSTADVVAQVELDTIVDRCASGMVLNLDDVDNPQNFVLAYHNGTRAKLVKCVAGTNTTVIEAVTAYAAGANLVVVKDGTSYALYYNNAQVGATSTISDAGIISNTLHGMFSTYSGNQLDNFQCFPRGTNGEFWSLEEFTRNAGHD
jgi:hypothetical protein